MRTVDLFCGCGAFSLGFQNAGFDIVAAFDNWDEAISVYRANFNHPVFKQDLLNVSESVAAIQKFAPEMIIGGPPCQDFSSAGKRDENNGRGDLTISYAEIIAAVQPQFFVMENVAGILKTQKIKIAIQILKNAGYGLTQAVLDASFCGVPQKRKRFVMLGKLQSADDFLNLKANFSKLPMTVRDYFGDSLDIDFYYRHPRSYVRRGIFSVDEPSPTIRGVNRPMPGGYQLRPNDPVNSKKGIRALSTMERAQIQTFPKDFQFLGNKTNCEQMIGNAVPVKLAEYIGRLILNSSLEKFLLQ